MNALAYIHGDIREQAHTFEVLRPAENDSVYNSDAGDSTSEFTDTGNTVEVAVFEPSSTSAVETEGVGQDVSLTGHLVPDDGHYVSNQPRVQVGDRLRLRSNTAKRYEVRTKDGVPNDIEPELIQLGLDPANSSA